MHRRSGPSQPHHDAHAEAHRLELRRLTGQASAEELREVERRDADPEAAAGTHRMRQTWEALELPPAPTVELWPELSQRLERRDDLTWGTASPWARAGAALALIIGIATGVIAGEVLDPRVPPPGAASSEVSAENTGASLADAYWRALEATDGRVVLKTNPGFGSAGPNDVEKP